MPGKLRTLWAIMHGERLRYAMAITAILLGVFFLYLQPIVYRAAIDHVIAGEDLEAPPPVTHLVAWLGGRSVLARNLWLAAVALAVLSAMNGVFGYFRGRWSAQASESVARRLRDRLYDHLQHLPCAYFDKAETGDLVQRCTSDVETIRTFLSNQVVEIGRSVVLLGFGVPFLVAMDPVMALISMCLVPGIVGFGAVFFARIADTFKKSDEAEGKMTSRLQENLTGIRVVRAFARQEHECESFEVHNAEYRRRWYRLIRLLSWYWPVSDLMCVCQTGLVLIAGGYFVTRGRMGVGTLFAFIAYVNMFLWPVRNMGRILADLGKAMVSIGRVGEILHAPAETDVPGAAELAPPDPPTVAAGFSGPDPRLGEIVIEHLGFSHGPDAPVLRDVSIRVDAGQTLAILGPAGSGKSTLINLLLRLYDYQQGSIRLDGVELRDLPRKRARSQVGAVLQEPFLFSRSLRENIKLGRSAARDEDMIQAASAACMHESIMDFEDGYDTLVGERGVTLSGGQRQRVAIARALLKDPPVLVLDDALSAVDTRTESAILQALRRRHGRQTTIVIAHRLSTLMHADRIIVLEGGRVVQAGTHQELASQEGMYRRLWQIQSSLEEDLRGELKSAVASGNGSEE